MGKIIVKKADITREDVDVIVNAANTFLSGGGGVDGAIHEAAGPSVMKECQEMGGCETGEAVMTNAGKLKADKIIHTPGPIWQGGNRNEPELLRNCYRNSFRIARENNFKKIAFPAISTGVYGYPIEKATRIALEEGKKNLEYFDEIRYVCYSEGDHQTYLRLYEEMVK